MVDVICGQGLSRNVTHEQRLSGNIQASNIWQPHPDRMQMAVILLYAGGLPALQDVRE